jgi:MSHA biogenesis protein MshK
MDERLSALCFAAVVSLTASPVLAQAGLAGLSDPTRPPTSAASQDEGATPDAARVQSILISPGRKVAVIDGQTVALGGRYGDATLVKIGVAEVTLKRGAQYETLHMFAGLGKDSGARAQQTAEEKPR